MAIYKGVLIMAKDVFELEAEKIAKISDENWQRKIYDKWVDSTPLFEYLPVKSGESSITHNSKDPDGKYCACCPTMLKGVLNDPDPLEREYSNKFPSELVKLIDDLDVPDNVENIERKHIPLFMQIQRLADKFRNKPLATIK